MRIGANHRGPDHRSIPAGLSVLGLVLLLLLPAPGSLRGSDAGSSTHPVRTEPPSFHAIGAAKTPGVNIPSAGNWTNLTDLSPRSFPPGRSFAGLTYDSADGYAVLFGGFNASGAPLGVAWTLGANWSWTPRNPSTAPTPRGGAALAYDPSDRVVVLFGGFGPNSTVLNDTWSFSAGAWHALSPATAPTARGYALMMPSPNGTGLVLFGGLSPTGPLNDTWWFHGTEWTDLTARVGPAPSARWQAAGTNLSAQGIDVLFGGNSSTGTLGDTWTLSAPGWNRLTVANSPPSRAAAAMAFDQVDEVAVMYGGYSPTLGPLVTVSSFNGTAWGPAYSGSLHPHNRFGASFSWVGGFGGGLALMFGGGSDVQHLFQGTWAYASRLPMILQAPTLSYPAVDTGFPVQIVANVTGGLPPISIRWTGLPSNCTGADSSSVRCLPVATGVVASLFAIQFIATDASGANATSPTIALKVNPALVIDKLLFSPSPVTAGSLLTIHVFVAGGQLPDRIVFDSLPPGCDSANTSSYTCRPLSDGVFLVNVTVTDPFGMSATASNYIQVEAVVNPIPLLQWGLVGGAVVIVAVLTAVLWSARRRRRGVVPPRGATTGPGDAGPGDASVP